MRHKTRQKEIAFIPYLSIGIFIAANINDLQQFDDYAGLSEADYQSVLYCVANGLIVGDERKLRCEAPLTQAEGVAMLSFCGKIVTIVPPKQVTAK